MSLAEHPMTTRQALRASERTTENALEKAIATLSRAQASEQEEGK